MNMGTVALVCISLAVGGVVGFLAGRRSGAKRIAAAPDPQWIAADAVVDVLRLTNEHLPREAEAVVSLALIMYPTVSDYVLARLLESPIRPD
jgi:hypothetical protein